MRYIHKVILIDGKYLGYQDDRSQPFSTRSDRETRRIAENCKDKYSKRVVYCSMEKLQPEFAKRQIYVDLAARHKSDFLLILDSDEYLEVSEWPEFMEELTNIKNQMQEQGVIYNVSMLDVDQRNYNALRPRLWYRPEQFCYNSRHNEFMRKDLKPLGPKHYIQQYFIEIIHCHKDCRSQYRQELQQDYEYRLESLERESHKL